jgi:hypothetical protein
MPPDKFNEGKLGPERYAADAAATATATATATAAPTTANAATAAPATTATTHVSKYGGPRRTVAARRSLSRHSTGPVPRPAWNDDARWTGRVHSRER